jgi:hypothetical protein
METATHTTVTQDILAEMLVENTGTHMLDSGGAYGRSWQRNAGKTVHDFLAEPEATCDGWGVTLSVFHYLSKRLKYSPSMQSRFNDHAEVHADESWLYISESFAETFADDDSDSWNTYNFDGDCLSQVLQGVSFFYHGDAYAIIQIHGGADVRGGYTRPRVFRITSDAPDCFPYDCIEYSLECTNNHTHSLSWRGEWIAYEGYSVDPDEAPLFDSVAGCAKCRACGSAMSAHAPEPY